MYKKILYLLVIVFSVSFLISCGKTTTINENTTTKAGITLPDLSGKNKSEIKTSLDGLSVDYVIIYETNNDLSTDEFIRYDGDDQIGDIVDLEHQVVVVIATSRLVLPDLAEKEQFEIISILSELGINFTTEIVTDNTVTDQTFSSYGDGLVAGDLIPVNFSVVVNIGFNSPKFPDLTGMIKEQIVNEMIESEILYQFDYIVNDDKAEDSFAGYQDVVAGEFYEEGTVTIHLYKNTFTDNETSLFFSKYVDGGDDTSDQAVEIYNPTEETLNLSDYHIVIYENGSLEVSYQIDFGDIDLLSGETYVIANTNADANILIKADLKSENLVFDGNDTIQLRYKNNTYIDTIYNIGNRGFVLDNEVFIRKETVVSGTRTFTFSEWYGFIPSFTSILGTYPIVNPTEITFHQMTTSFHDPNGGMDLVTLTHIADGDTAYFYPGFQGDDRVRFVGTDTPETYPVTDDWGPEAKAYTTLILNSALRIYIQSDPDIGTTGNYGRSLGLVWVDLGETGLTIEILDSSGQVMRTENLTGWILLNYHLILNGYSYNYYSDESTLAFDNKYIFRWFQEAERFAQENGLGIHE